MGFGDGSSVVESVLTDRQGDTWIATQGGLGLNPVVGGAASRYDMGLPLEGSLPHEHVLSLYEDGGGVLWVGTWDGLARLGPFHRVLRFLPRSAISPQSPRGQVVL